MVKNRVFFAWQLLILVTFVALSVASADAQITPKLKKVKVYFWEVNNESGGDELKPFMRQVDAKSPLRPTIEVLIAGPNAEEEKKRFFRRGLRQFETCFGQTEKRHGAN